METAGCSSVQSRSQEDVAKRVAQGVQSHHQDAGLCGCPLCQVETKWVGLGAHTSLPCPARVGDLWRMMVFSMVPATAKASRKWKRQYMKKVGAKAATVPAMAT